MCVWQPHPKHNDRIKYMVKPKSDLPTIFQHVAFQCSGIGRCINGQWGTFSKMDCGLAKDKDCKPFSSKAPKNGQWSCDEETCQLEADPNVEHSEHYDCDGVQQCEWDGQKWTWMEVIEPVCTFNGPNYCPDQFVGKVIEHGKWDCDVEGFSCNLVAADDEHICRGNAVCVENDKGVARWEKDGKAECFALKPSRTRGKDVEREEIYCFESADDEGVIFKTKWFPTDQEVQDGHFECEWDDKNGNHYCKLICDPKFKTGKLRKVKCNHKTGEWKSKHLGHEEPICKVAPTKKNR